MKYSKQSLARAQEWRNRSDEYKKEWSARLIIALKKKVIERKKLKKLEDSRYWKMLDGDK